MEHHHTEHNKDNYIPLVVILVLIVSVAAITSLDQGLYAFVVHFMTGFFLVFGGLKLFNLKEFALGYASYDLLAMRWRGYGYIYPFIELAFGFSMLAGFHPHWLLGLEAAVMLFGGVSVIHAIKKQKDIKCVCLGNVLEVPLTHVSFLENFGMTALATLLIVW